MRLRIAVGVVLASFCLLCSLLASADEIAFTGYSGGRYQVFVIEDDGTGLRQLTDGQYNDYNPKWSSDGSQIAFFSDQGAATTAPGRRAVYLIDADGSGERTLLASNVGSFHWGRDGTMVFTVNDPPTALYKILEPGVTSPVLVDSSHTWQGGTISPDGSKILSNGNSVVYLINSDGTYFRTLSNPESYGGPSGWHPESRLFVNHGHVYVEIVDSENNDRTTIATFSGGGKPSNSEWSPDGKSIVFVNPTGSSVSQITYIYDVESQILTDFDNEIVRAGDWSSDSSKLAVTSYVGGQYKVASFNPSTGIVTSLYGPVAVDPVLFDIPRYSPRNTVSSSLALLTPNGGQLLFVENTCEITWESTGSLSDLVDIEYSLDGGANWFSLKQEAPNTGSYNWDVHPDAVGDEVIIKVEASDGAATYSDLSDASFSVQSISPQRDEFNTLINWDKRNLQPPHDQGSIELPNELEDGRNLVTVSFPQSTNVSAGAWPDVSIITPQQRQHGTYAARLKAAACDPNEGIVSGFFTYWAKDMDDCSSSEIDFEFLGHDPEWVYMTLWTGTGSMRSKITRAVNMDSGVIREMADWYEKSDEWQAPDSLPKSISQTIDGFDCTRDYYVYEFEWKANEVYFYIYNDSEKILLWQYDDLPHIPQHPAQLIFNVWYPGPPDDTWLAMDSNQVPDAPTSSKNTLFVDWAEFPDPSLEYLQSGNINSDGAINLLDVRLCCQIAQGVLTGTSIQRELADVDHDGDVDMDDAQILAEYVVGIRTTLP